MDFIQLNQELFWHESSKYDYRRIYILAPKKSSKIDFDIKIRKFKLLIFTIKSYHYFCDDVDVLVKNAQLPFCYAS